jgi:hypothetical protein
VVLVIDNLLWELRVEGYKKRLTDTFPVNEKNYCSSFFENEDLGTAMKIVLDKTIDGLLCLEESSAMFPH